MIKGTQISGAGCEGGRRSGKHWSWILIKSLKRVETRLPLSARLKQSAALPGSFPLFLRPPLHIYGAPRPSPSPPPADFLSFTPNGASTYGLCWCVFFSSPFVESFLLALTLSHCFAEGPAFQELPTASRSAQPEHLAALSDLYFQLFGGFRALPSTTDRKWGARRLSAQPQTLKAEDTTALSGPTAFERMCVNVCLSRWRVISNSSHPENVLLRMWCF